MYLVDRGQGAANHLTMHKETHLTKNYPGQNVTNAAVQKADLWRAALRYVLPHCTSHHHDREPACMEGAQQCLLVADKQAGTRALLPPVCSFLNSPIGTKIKGAKGKR